MVTLDKWNFLNTGQMKCRHYVLLGSNFHGRQDFPWALAEGGSSWRTADLLEQQQKKTRCIGLWKFIAEIHSPISPTTRNLVVEKKLFQGRWREKESYRVNLRICRGFNQKTWDVALREGYYHAWPYDLKAASLNYFFEWQ